MPYYLEALVCKSRVVRNYLASTLPHAEIFLYQLFFSGVHLGGSIVSVIIRLANSLTGTKNDKKGKASRSLY
jgi:hypothetical protein